MSEHDDPTEEHELYEEVPPRSIFAATWFRVLLVVIVIGVIGAVAIPYVLDFMNPPPSRPVAASKPPSPPVAIPSTPTTSSSPAADKSDAPAPTAPEPKPAPPAARSVEPKPAAPKADSRTAAVPADKGKSAMAVTETTPPKPTTSAKPAPKPDTATKADVASKADTTTKSDMTVKTASPTPKADSPSKADTPPKDVIAKADTAKPVVAAKPVPEPKRIAATATAKAPTGSGPFWVQVGAFKDAETAKRIAAKLREDNFKVEESVTRKGGGVPAAPTPTPAAPAAKPAAPAAKPDIAADQYDVLVSGQTPEELNKRLAAKGLAAEASSGGMVVKPSLPLRDAVALSKDLAVEGFKVQVRRAGGSMGSASPAPTPTPAAAAPTEGGSELHRVRVGGFADRAAALDVVRQLEAKGYKPYIARGEQ